MWAAPATRVSARPATLPTRIPFPAFPTTSTYASATFPLFVSAMPSSVLFAMVPPVPATPSPDTTNAPAPVFERTIPFGAPSDATLRTVSYPETRGKLSGMGTAVGYCGTVFVGLLIFFLNVPVADRFRLTAILFLVFAIPIFLAVREPKVADAKAVTVADIRDAFGQLRRSIAHAREVPGLGRFLLGRFFYSDAVNTVIVVMSVVTTEVFPVGQVGEAVVERLVLELADHGRQAAVEGRLSSTVSSWRPTAAARPR